MLNAKIVLFFTCEANGWEEVYYTNSTSLGDGYNAGLALANVRKNLMGSPTTLDAIRVEDPDALRASVLTPLGFSAPVASGFYTSEADNPNVAAMMRLYGTGSATSRPLYLRGNPDSAYDREFPNTADAQTWKTQYKALGDFLSGNGGGAIWQIKSRIFPIPTGGSKNVFDVSLVAPDVATKSRLVITSVAAHGLAVGNYVTLYKMGIPRLGGTFKVVTVPDANTFSIPFALPSGATYPGGGYGLKFTANPVAINSYTFNPRWTRRDTGRPFDVTRGRRRSIPR